MKMQHQHNHLKVTIALLWFLTTCLLLFFLSKKAISFYQLKKEHIALEKTFDLQQRELSQKNKYAFKSSLKKEEINLRSLLQKFPDPQQQKELETQLDKPSSFQKDLQKNISLLLEKTAETHATLPLHFSLGFKRTEQFFPNKKERALLVDQRNALYWLADYIIKQPRLELQQFDLKQPKERDQKKNIISLGSVTLKITTDELSFQKIVNAITEAPYFFVIKNIAVENSQPNSPASPEKLESCDKQTPSQTTGNHPHNITILLGQEKIIVTMSLELFKINTAAIDKTFFSDQKNSQPFKVAKESESTPIWSRLVEGTPLFISRHYFSKEGELHDLLDEKKPLYPPVPNEWLVAHQLDYSNPNILSEDPDHDGFSNLEEWLGNKTSATTNNFSSDPNDPTSHPLLWTKLRYTNDDLQKSNVLLEFAGYEEENGHTTFELQPKTALPHVTAEGKKIENTKRRYVSLGEKVEGLPFFISDFKKKEELHHDVLYDVSELTLQHEATGEQVTLVKKSALHPDPINIANLEGVQLHYLLPQQPQTITVRRGDIFSLESLPLPPESRHAGEKSYEQYRLLQINKDSLEIQKEGIQYTLPISLSISSIFLP